VIGHPGAQPGKGERECHNRRMNSQAAAPMPLTSRASGWRTSGKFCVSLALVWSLLGASVCGLLFVASLIPQHGSYPTYSRSLPVGLNDTGVVLTLFMVPLCMLIPVPLLIAGRRYLRCSHAGTRRVAAWTAVASAGIAVEALFLLRLYDFMTFSHWLYPRSWHALELSVGFLIVGAAMASVLLGNQARGRSGRGYVFVQGDA
jgi:hypothetical protein